MCTWMTELPAHSQNGETPRKPNLALYIKPTPPKEYYRFRLLGFKSAKSDRDYPFITRFIHTVWVEGEDGKRHTENVVCPVTPFVKKNWKGDPMNDCPICRFANANFVAWKQSGWKDKESAKKNKEFGRKFEALIPVYVVNDPNYQQNNGHFRVFTISDKDVYNQFVKLVQEKSREAVVFNGKNALDFYMRYEMIEEVLRQGQPNEYVWKHPVLKQMGFTNKPYDIPQITKEAIDDFPFDETYYVGATMSELEDFYNRHIKVSNDDIPDDEEITLVQPTQKKFVEKTNSIENTEVASQPKDDGKPLADMPFDDIDDEEPQTPKAKTPENGPVDLDDLLEDEEEPKKEVAAPVKKEEAKGEILESPKDPMKTETSDEDIDSLLNDIL